MKKIISILFAIMMLCTTAFAESGVILMGARDARTPDSYHYVNEVFNNQDQKFVVGTNLQGEYQSFWLNKGFHSEQTPTEKDLSDFVKYVHYDNVLFLIVDEPLIETSKDGFPKNAAFASVTVKAFLADGSSVLKSTSISKEDDSETSQLRAKRGAFKRCLQEVKSQLDL